ncbi:ComEA family DNA-binding protein [Litchfieldella rifensis]|uniref:ComEA family DNA-binding protein n=1 Tax=Litchfieldella rifensis TaxID=762643 RepID=A0ABV7LJV1_9GAMM
MKTLLKTLALSLLLGTASMAVAQDVAPININTANAELLAELPGIGSTKAQAIVEDRDNNGPFADADDLTRVNGIGEGTVANLSDQVEF